MQIITASKSSHFTFINFIINLNVKRARSFVFVVLYQYFHDCAKNYVSQKRSGKILATKMDRK